MIVLVILVISSLKAVERIVNNCLNELIDNNLDSISFPALGTGSLKYPIEIVAHTMVSTCYNFLNNNKNYGCSINLVISDEFPDILRVNSSNCYFSININLIILKSILAS